MSHPHFAEPVVLFVDDEPLVTRALKRALFAEPFRILTADSPEEALEILAREHVDIVVSDELMPTGSGAQLLAEVRQTYPKVVRIIHSGHASVESSIRAINDAAVFRFLEKPCRPKELAAVLHEALRCGQGASGEHTDLRGKHVTEALDRLRIVFQPIFRADDGTAAAVEVLTRVDHPCFPAIPELLDEAEALGRVAEVDAAIFRLIVAALPQIHPDLKVFVNTHPQTFGVRELWLDGGVLEPHLPRLVIEVTERGVMHEGAALRQMLGELRARGARIALDDLGAGYAALSVVTILRPEVIKLDMSLVRDVDQDEARADLVQALVDLAHRLGATLVAEGVETVGERDTLCALGCDLLQGYLLARPGAIEAIPAPRSPEAVREVFQCERRAANRPPIGEARTSRWTA